MYGRHQIGHRSAWPLEGCSPGAKAAIDHSYGVGGLVCEVVVYDDGTYKLKSGKSTSRFWKPDEIGHLYADGLQWIFVPECWDGVVPGAGRPFLALPTTER